MTPLAKQVLAAASTHYQTSESNLVEAAVRLIRWRDNPALRAALAAD